LERKKIRTYVLDASVAVKWFVDEDASDKARLLRDSFVRGQSELVAPDLLKYELANALRSHPIAVVDRSTLLRAMDALDNYQFLITPSKETWALAIELSYSTPISLYDGVYVGLSQMLKSPLVTADQKLIRTLPPRQRPSAIALSQIEFE
jgi:predicted nucleic acid-binding protein